MFYKEETNNFAWMTYINPFEKYTWLLIGITIVVCGVFLFVTTRFGDGIEEDYDFDFLLSLMIMIHGMLNQGAPYEPKKLSARFKLKSHRFLLTKHPGQISLLQDPFSGVVFHWTCGLHLLFCYAHLILGSENYQATFSQSGTDASGYQLQHCHLDGTVYVQEFRVSS